MGCHDPPQLVWPAAVRLNIIKRNKRLWIIDEESGEDVSYIEENPHLLQVLRAQSGLSDIFGQPGRACQATELWRIKNER